MCSVIDYFLRFFFFSCWYFCFTLHKYINIIYFIIITLLLRDVDTIWSKYPVFYLLHKYKNLAIEMTQICMLLEIHETVSNPLLIIKAIAFAFR